MKLTTKMALPASMMISTTTMLVGSKHYRKQKLDGTTTECTRPRRQNLCLELAIYNKEGKLKLQTLGTTLQITAERRLLKRGRDARALLLLLLEGGYAPSLTGAGGNAMQEWKGHEHRNDNKNAIDETCSLQCQQEEE